MNTEKQIEECLSNAPRPQASKTLLNRLEDGVSSTKFNVSRTPAYKWFTPKSDRVSFTRVAAAAIISIAVLLPLAYGATRLIKHFIIDGVRITVKEDSGKAITEEDARNSLREFGELYREGKAKMTKPGVWVVTLSNGEEFAYSGSNPEWAGLSPEEKNKLLKAQNEEIQKLRKSGNFERTFIKEVEENGVKIHLYEDRFTLSSGKVVTMTYGEAKSTNGTK
jgi:hypothetical protein